MDGRQAVAGVVHQGRHSRRGCVSAVRVMLLHSPKVAETTAHPSFSSLLRFFLLMYALPFQPRRSSPRAAEDSADGVVEGATVSRSVRCFLRSWRVQAWASALWFLGGSMQ